MKKNYPRDISRDQYEEIRELLESARKQTPPYTIDLYDVFCAVLYLLRTGCQWRLLPSDYPKWRTVHYYFTVWSAKPEDGESLLEQALKKQLANTRVKQNRLVKTSFCIVDSQSVKNTDCAKNKGDDAGKKVSGIKRHLFVDNQD